MCICVEGILSFGSVCEFLSILCIFYVTLVYVHVPSSRCTFAVYSQLRSARCMVDFN